MRVITWIALAGVVVLTGCETPATTTVPEPHAGAVVLETDGPCGPGAWTSERRADGTVDRCVPDGW